MDDAFVLDSFAVLALLAKEPGGEDVAGLLRQADEGRSRLLMPWVNLGEVAYIVERRWGPERLHAVLGTLEATALEIVPVGRELALRAARLKAQHAIAYADAFAAALAQHSAATLVTGDPEFASLEEVLAIQWLRSRER